MKAIAAYVGGEIGALMPNLVASAGLEALPVVLFGLRQAASRAVEAEPSTASSQDDEDSSSSENWSRATLACLRALASLATDSVSALAILRSLQPLITHGETLREPNVKRRVLILACLGLRTATQTWVETRKGLNHVTASLEALGAYEHGSAGGGAPELLRITRAICILDIAREQPDKALKLVGALDQCLSDPSPRVKAIALDAIAVMVDADVLEFFSAWAVVLQHIPTLPTNELAARKWLALLACGASADVDTQHEQVQGNLELHFCNPQ